MLLRWFALGWELGADPRHSELIIEQPKLDTVKPLTTLGCDDDEKDDEESLTPRVVNDVALFRSLAARCNYLSVDRPDLMYAAKDVCREMAKRVLN